MAIDAAHLTLIVIQALISLSQIIVVSYLIIFYGNKRQVVAREPIFLAITALGAALFFFSTEIIFADAADFDSAAGRQLEFWAEVGEATFFLSVLIRSFRIWIIIKINQQKLQLYEQKGLDSSTLELQQSSLLKYSRLSFLMTLYFAVWIPVVLIDAAFVSILPSRGGSADLTMFIVLGSFYLIGFSFFIIVLRPVNDSFRVSRELYTMALTMVLSRLAIYIDVFGRGTNADNRTVTFWPSFLQLMASSLVLYYSSVHPLILVLREERFKKKAAIDTPLLLDAANFEKLLEDDESRAAFIKFSLSEFSIQNLLFYSDVQEFKVTVENKRQMARDIVKKYIDANSPLQITFTSQQGDSIEDNSTSENIREQVAWDVQAGNINNSVFAPAEDQIFLDMQSDSFARFLLSREYRNMKKAHAEEAKTLSQYNAETAKASQSPLVSPREAAKFIRDVIFGRRQSSPANPVPTNLNVSTDL